MKVLFTSADPGSGQQNDSLAFFLKRSGIHDVSFICSKPCLLYYKESYRNRSVLEVGDDDLDKKINNLIDNFEPDFIFVGLSNSKSDIDYLTTKIAIKRKIRTACVQDYYGFIGAYNKMIKPDYFFVIDDYAKELTISCKILRAEKIIAIGSPKHFNYFNKIDEWVDKLKDVRLPNRELIFFLQPLSIYEIKYSFIKLCEIIQKINPGYKLNVKPHPKDEDSRELKTLTENYPINIIESNIPTEVLLLYFQNIINCYSTIAYDYFFIKQHVASLSNSKLFNLFLSKNIFKLMNSCNLDIKKTPQYKIGINIIHQKNLIENLNEIFKLDFYNSPKLAKKNHSDFSNSIKEIMKVLEGV